MKTIQNISKLFLASLVFIACSTEDPGELDASLHNPDPETPAVNAGVLTSDVDGNPFTADFTTAVSNNGVIILEGKTGTTTVALRFPDNIVPNGTGNPYVLAANSTAYSGNYNTAINVTSTSSTEAKLQVDFDNEITGTNETFYSDNEVFSIQGGITNLKGIVGADGESVNILLQTDQAGAHTFGPITATPTLINTINYREPGAGAPTWNADTVVANGAISLDIDTANKLVSGTFNFDGIRINTIGNAPNYGTADADGDGVVDLKENELGTDVDNANDPIQIAGYTGYVATNAIWMAADGDNDGITNADELAATPPTDPYEGNVDTDGDGVSDLQENVQGSDVADPCSPTQNEFYTAYDAANTTWMAADCDGDGINNGAELAATPATNPYFVEMNMKAFTNGTFSKVTYDDGLNMPVLWGLNIIAHDTAAKTISGTFSYVSKSIGETPVRAYVITGGAFNVTYE